MNMDIKLFRHIENSDYGLSASFSLAKLEFKERSAIAVVRFCLHTPDGLEWRNSVFNFDKYGEVTAFGKILADTYEYARIADTGIGLQKAEKELGEAVCAIISLAVQKHFAKGE